MLTMMSSRLELPENAPDKLASTVRHAEPQWINVLVKSLPRMLAKYGM
jgi:hypothetical protein